MVKIIIYFWFTCHWDNFNCDSYGVGSDLNCYISGGSKDFRSGGAVEFFWFGDCFDDPSTCPVLLCFENRDECYSHKNTRLLKYHIYVSDISISKWFLHASLIFWLKITFEWIFHKILFFWVISRILSSDSNHGGAL